MSRPNYTVAELRAMRIETLRDTLRYMTRIRAQMEESIETVRDELDGHVRLQLIDGQPNAYTEAKRYLEDAADELLSPDPEAALAALDEARARIVRVIEGGEGG